MESFRSPLYYLILFFAVLAVADFLLAFASSLVSSLKNPVGLLHEVLTVRSRQLVLLYFLSRLFFFFFLFPFSPLTKNPGKTKAVQHTI